MKKMMLKLLLAVVKFLCIIGLLYLSLALVLCIPRVLGTLEKNRLALIAGGGFVVGLPLFCFLRLNSLYVFGHELTHWVMAKIFLRKTGRFQSGKNAGAVEVENPNVWIILAPYVLPFYLLVVIGLYGLIMLIANASIHPYAVIAFAVLIGLSYAYHVILTIIALRTGQADLKMKGKILSLMMVITGNLLFIFMALIMATRQWRAGFKALTQQILAQAEVIIDVMQRVVDKF
ncbi:MAG: hypothetical protein PHT80_13110 [Lentisphaeria bacterium]|nr:hypothetical protein [Lentisphaeria bacterium]